MLVINIPDWVDEDQAKNNIRASDPNLIDVPVRVRENPGGGRVAQLNVPMSVAVNMAERGSGLGERS